MNLGEKIKFFRKRINLNEKQLAGMLRITEETIKQYEAGKEVPTAEMLKEISHRLRINPIYFFESKEKTLLAFPMDYEAFQQWCHVIQTRYNRPFIDIDYFEYAMKSDRYFIALKQQYLIRLQDNFYFVPIVSKWYGGSHYQMVDFEQMRKVLNEDIVFVERELHKKNLFRLDARIFSKDVYVSKYDYVDPIYLSDTEETALFEIASHCNHIVGYNERHQMFYLLETNGINRIPLAKELPQGLLNEKSVYLDVQRKKLLSSAEVKELILYVLSEEEFIRRIQRILKKDVRSEASSFDLTSNDVFLNMEALEKKEALSAHDYRAVAHFLRMRYWAIDNIKRMLYLTQDFTDSIFDHEWRLAPDASSVEAEGKEKTEEALATKKEPGKALSILLAEDSTFMRSVLSNILKRHFSCEVEEAKDGEIALEKFQEKNMQGKTYDLILIDITMPKVDGFTLLKQLIELDKEATIVMCSSVTNKKIVVESIRNGAKHFITKPVEEEDMVAIIKKVLMKKTNR